MHKRTTIEVLGCSGSIGIPRQGTTCYLIDDDILIDAGTGLGELGIARLEKINHVLITHSHLDHLCCLPLLLDAVGVERSEPLKVYAAEETLQALKQHVFNNVIWPDFSRIPNAEKPVLEYVVLPPGQKLVLAHREIETIRVEHSVPTVAVLVRTSDGAWCYSGDTHRTDLLYSTLNREPNLLYLLIESAFPNREKWLADLSKHLCPSLLAEELGKLKSNCEVWVNHLKPRDHDLTVQELQQISGHQPLQILSAGMKFSF